MGIIANLLGLFIAGTGVAYILYARPRRADIGAKYRPGSIEYRLYMQYIGNGSLIGCTLLFTTFLIALIQNIKGL
jgi:hypothetical protein